MGEDSKDSMELCDGGVSTEENDARRQEYEVGDAGE
jgi:hypothetical protein